MLLTDDFGERWSYCSDCRPEDDMAKNRMIGESLQSISAQLMATDMVDDIICDNLQERGTEAAAETRHHRFNVCLEELYHWTAIRTLPYLHTYRPTWNA